MADDVLITPGSRKIEWYGTDSALDATIQTDTSGNLSITNVGGDIAIGDVTADLYIGNGVNNVDIVFEQNGEIRGTTGVTLTLGQADSSVQMGTNLSINGYTITGLNSLNVGGAIDAGADNSLVVYKNILVRGATAASDSGIRFFDPDVSNLQWITRNAGGSYSIYSANDTFTSSTARLTINGGTGAVAISSTTASTTTTSGALTVNGGVGVGGDVYANLFVVEADTGEEPLLAMNNPAWATPYHEVMGFDFATGTKDTLILKVPGNSVGAHGTMYLGDEHVYFGVSTSSLANVDNASATAPFATETWGYLGKTGLTVNGPIVGNVFKETIATSSGTSKAFDLGANSVFWHSMTGPGTFSFTNTPASNTVQTITIITEQSTANSTITWPAAVLWPGNVQPTQSTAAGEIDFWSITIINKGGVLYYIGNLVAKDAS